MSLSTEQQANANAIIAVAKSDFSDPIQAQKAAVIGIITALTESNLINVNYGDRDSLGLFQQRGSWGSAQTRMNPSASAQLFFTRLQGIQGWDKMDPGTVAQKIQVSAYPARYDTHLTEAQSIVGSLVSQIPSSSVSGPGSNLLGVPNSLFSPQFWLRFGVGALGAVVLTFAIIALLKDTSAGSAAISTVKDAVS